MHEAMVTVYWWQSWGWNSSLLSLHPGLCIWHFEKPEKLCLWEATFSLLRFRGVCYSWAPLIWAMFFSPIIPKESLVTFATSNIPCLTWHTCFRVVEIDRSCRAWWGCVQSHWLQRCFDGLLLFSFLSDELSQTVAEVPASEGMEPFPDSCILLASLKPLI